jgi:hypothetical protein
VRRGVARGQESKRRLVRQVRLEHTEPARSEDLEQRVETRQALTPPLREGLGEPRRPPERITEAESPLLVQAFGMEHRQASEHAGVDPVRLRVLGVVGAQVRQQRPDLGPSVAGALVEAL